VSECFLRFLLSLAAISPGILSYHRAFCPTTGRSVLPPCILSYHRAFCPTTGHSDLPPCILIMSYITLKVREKSVADLRSFVQFIAECKTELTSDAHLSAADLLRKIIEFTSFQTYLARSDARCSFFFTRFTLFGTKYHSCWHVCHPITSSGEPFVFLLAL
jgi:hypothetical protein